MSLLRVILLAVALFAMVSAGSTWLEQGVTISSFTGDIFAVSQDIQLSSVPGLEGVFNIYTVNARSATDSIFFSKQGTASRDNFDVKVNYTQGKLDCAYDKIEPRPICSLRDSDNRMLCFGDVWQMTLNPNESSLPLQVNVSGEVSADAVINMALPGSTATQKLADGLYVSPQNINLQAFPSQVCGHASDSRIVRLCYDEKVKVTPSFFGETKIENLFNECSEDTTGQVKVCVASENSIDELERIADQIMQECVPLNVPIGFGIIDLRSCFLREIGIVDFFVGIFGGETEAQTARAAFDAWAAHNCHSNPSIIGSSKLASGYQSDVLEGGTLHVISDAAVTTSTWQLIMDTEIYGEYSASFSEQRFTTCEFTVSDVLLSAPPNLQVGQSVLVSYTVTNTGSNMCTLQAKVSAPSGETRLATFPDLIPGESSRHTTNAIQIVAPGNCDFTVTVSDLSGGVQTVSPGERCFAIDRPLIGGLLEDVNFEEALTGGLGLTKFNEESCGNHTLDPGETCDTCPSDYISATRDSDACAPKGSGDEKTGFDFLMMFIYIGVAAALAVSLLAIIMARKGKGQQIPSERIIPKGWKSGGIYPIRGE